MSAPSETSPLSNYEILPKGNSNGEGDGWRRPQLRYNTMFDNTLQVRRAARLLVQDVILTRNGLKPVGAARP